MEKESNGELAFLDTLLKRNNGEISVLAYKKPTNTDQYLHYSSHHQTSCKIDIEKALLIKFLGELLIITACLSHNN